MSEEVRQFEIEISEGVKKAFTVRHPTNQEIEDAEFQYSRAFNNAIVKGILPQAKLINELKSNGVWGDSDEQNIEDQRLRVIELEDALEESSDEDKERISTTLGEERQQLLTLRQARADILSHSAESKAEDAQRSFIISRVVEYADTKARLWKEFRDYQNESDTNIMFRATYEYLTFANGLPSDFIEKLPENQVSKSEEESEETTEETKEEVAPAPPAPAPSAVE